MRLRGFSGNVDGSFCEKLDADGPPVGERERESRRRERRREREEEGEREGRTARGHGRGLIFSRKSGGRTAVPHPAEPPSLSRPPPPPLNQPPPSLARSPPLSPCRPAAAVSSPCGRPPSRSRGPPSPSRCPPSPGSKPSSPAGGPGHGAPLLRPAHSACPWLPGPGRRALRVPHHRHGSDPSRCSGQTEWDSDHGARPAARPGLTAAALGRSGGQSGPGQAVARRRRLPRPCLQSRVCAALVVWAVMLFQSWLHYY